MWSPLSNGYPGTGRCAVRVFSRSPQADGAVMVSSRRDFIAARVSVPTTVLLTSVDYHSRTNEHVAHTVRSATVGGIRDARIAGMSPATAPITRADPIPAAHA